MDAFDDVIAKFRTKGLLIDSNLLLLLLVGGAESGLIAKLKRTNQFTLDDYEILWRFVSRFARIVTTPHILCEVSNLVKGPNRELLIARMAQWIQILEDRHVSGREAVSDDRFAQLGLTDTAINLPTTGELLALTIDAALASYIAYRGGDVINFNHLRSFGLP